MAISLVAVGDKIKAGVINAVIKQVNATALNGIVPTSVNGTGVAMTANGQVTFTNATTVSLDGVFTGTYDNYRITWSSSTRSAVSAVNFRLRQAGADVTTATYDWGRSVASGTTTTVSSSSSATAAPLDTGVAVGQRTSGVFDIFGPALAAPMLGTCNAATLAASALTGVGTWMANEAASAVDGFSIYAITGTWSGTLRVYGYNNLT